MTINIYEATDEALNEKLNNLDLLIRQCASALNVLGPKVSELEELVNTLKAGPPSNE